MNRKDFGARLRALRERQKFSQRALGRRAGLSADYISRLEHGNSSPTLDTITKLAKALRVSKAALTLEDYDEADDLAQLIRELPEIERDVAFAVLGTLRVRAAAKGR